QRWSETGSVAPKRSGGGGLPLGEDSGWVLVLIAKHPEFTLEGVLAALAKKGNPRRRSALIEALGASALYLPSYSPDLNPIEQFFSKLKALLRQAAERTIPNLWRRIRLLLRTVCPGECANFLRHAGYVSK